MPTIPSSVFSWGATAPITVPTSGKISAGFAPSERGAAQYFNYGFNLIGQWVGWYNDGCTEDQYILPGTGSVRCTVTAANWFDIYGTFFPQSINDTIVIPIPRKINDVITQVQAYVTDVAANAFKWDFILSKRLINSATVSQIGTTQTSAGTGALQTLTIGSLTETVAATACYVVTLQPHTGSSSFGTASTFGLRVSGTVH